MAPSTGAYGGDGRIILGVTWGEAMLATTTVLLRACSAKNLIKKPEWDLFWILTAWITSMVAQTILSVSVAYGTGNKLTRLTVEDIFQGQKWSWVGQIVAIHSTALAKVAVIALMLRLQGETHPKKKLVLHFLWITNTILNIAQTAFILEACTPLEKLWNDFLPGDCSFRKTTSLAGYIQGSWMAASDLVLASYPIFVFWSQESSIRTKIGLCALIGGGYFAATAGILKTLSTVAAVSNRDEMYSLHPFPLTGVTQMWLVIILASTPQLRILSKSKAPLRENETRAECPADKTACFNDKTLRNSTVEGMGYNNSIETTSNNHATRADPPLSRIVVTKSYSVTYDDEEIEPAHTFKGNG